MNHRTIIQLLKHYFHTGMIHDDLIPFFDQTGKWRGDTIRWPETRPESLLAVIKHSHLSKSRRTSNSPMGPILLTSWYTESDVEVRLEYAVIKGSLLAYGDKPVIAAGLRYIGGHCSTTTTRRIDLPNLVHVGGNLEAASSFRLQAPRLRTVGGRLKITGTMPPLLESVGRSLSTFWGFDFCAPKLKHVGGILIPHKAELVDVPVLEAIGGGLLLANTNRRLNAPMLRSIGGDFLASSTTNLRAPKLRTIAGDMDTRAAKHYYHPDIRVGGQWTICPGAVDDWLIREAARQAIRGAGIDFEI